MHKASHYVKHYLPLVAVLKVAIIGFILFSYDQRFQIAIIISAAIGYVVWGISHHLIHKDLDFKVAMEYVFIALVGTIVVLSLIFRT